MGDTDTEPDTTDSDTGLTDTIAPALTLMATTSARDPLMPSPLLMLMPTSTTDTTDTDTDTDITDTDMEDTADTMVADTTVMVWDTDTPYGESKKLESTQT